MRFGEEILDIISRFEKAGHEAYVVGGSLRDRLLGRDAFDVDMTVSALPEETVSLFHDMRVIPTGIKHGTVTVLTPSGAPVEITTFRTDGSYSDSRHPDKVTFTRSLPEDLARRDFTVNAMAYSPEKGTVDLFDGKKDLENKIIRCVGEPKKRFSEDALRILRAFRFSAQLDFSIESETYEAAVALGEKITALARERVAVELMKLLSAPRVAHVLDAMEPILGYVLPDTPIKSERFSLCDRLYPDPVARLALLIYGGDAGAVAQSLRFSTADKQRLKALSMPREIPRTEADARRMLAGHSNTEDCIACVKIASLIKGEDLEKIERMIASVSEKAPCLSVSELAVNGKDLMGIGVEKGKQLGIVLHRLLDAVIEKPELNQKSALLTLAGEIMGDL